MSQLVSSLQLVVSSSTRSQSSCSSARQLVYIETSTTTSCCGHSTEWVKSVQFVAGEP